MIEVRRWAMGLWKTLTSPVPGTFKELGQLGEEKPIASLVVLSFALLVLYLVSFYSPGTSISIMDMILTMITGVVMIGFWVAIIHFLYQRMFHRKEVVFNQLLFVGVCTFIVTQTLGVIIWFVPMIGEARGVIEIIYLVALTTSAVMGVTRLSFVRSVAIIIISIPITIIFMFFIYSLLPIVPKVLSGI
jgi:hypothetical protein